MIPKRKRFYEEVERMKAYYRRFSTEKLRQLSKVGPEELKAYGSAVKEVLKEREGGAPDPTKFDD